MKNGSLVVRGSLTRGVFGFWFLAFGLESKLFAVFREKNEKNPGNPYQTRSLSVSRTREKAVKKP